MPPERPPAEPSDREVLQRAAAGDLEAFSEIYQRHQQTVYRFARAMTGSSDAAEDITQEVFVSLITDVARYDPARASFPTYVYGIVRNLSRRRLRKQRELVPLDTSSALPAGANLETPADRLEGAEQIAAVRRALLRLPSKYRELVLLCDVHGLSYAEASAIVNASVPAVRSRLHRGRHLLRLRLSAVAPARSQRGIHPVRCPI